MACAVRQQAITWANVDPVLCRHVGSLGHNELKQLTVAHTLFSIAYITDLPDAGIMID